LADDIWREDGHPLKKPGFLANVGSSFLELKSLASGWNFSFLELKSLASGKEKGGHR
jgi:hypothetical protein